MAKQKRKQLVIEPVIQYSLVRQLLVQWGLHLVATLLLLTMLQVLLGGFFNSWQYHLQRIWPTLASFTISLLFLLPVYIANSLKLSNRFAGPIHRFRRELRSLANGRPYQELKFRDSDYWTEMADELELAIAAIKEQLAQELANSSPQSASQTTTPATGNAGRGIVIASDEGLPTTPAPTPSSNS